MNNSEQKPTSINKQPQIIVPSQQELHTIAQHIHEQIAAAFPDVHQSDSSIVDGLTKLLEVCALYHRNRILQINEIDNTEDQE